MFVRALLVKTTLHFKEFWRMMKKKDFWEDLQLYEVI